MRVDGNKEDGVEDSVDGGDKHPSHLSPTVDCCLKERSKQTMCVDNNKEDGVEDSVDNSVDFG
eukprot:7109258-Ditylum_brightwellii.AAC.1